MKIRVRVVSNGKVVSGSAEVPNKAHFEAQLKFPKLVQKDKTKYTRKEKHKKDIAE